MRAYATLLSVLLVLGCEKTLPGEVVGAFQIVMHTAENSCGPRAVPFGEGSTYRVELREEEPRGFWRLPNVAPTEGSYRNGEFQFTPAPQVLEFGRAQDGTAGCLVIREETLFGSVTTTDAGVRSSDAGDAPRADLLTGEHRISFRADPSGRCALATGPLGVLERVPCVARFRLDGTPRAAF